MGGDFWWFCGCHFLARKISVFIFINAKHIFLIHQCSSDCLLTVKVVICTVRLLLDHASICLSKQSFFHPGGCVCFTPGTAEPGVHACHYEDDILSSLPRHGLCETVFQLLQQRHEGLSGQPGRPQHGVEAPGRWAPCTYTHMQKVQLTQDANLRPMHLDCSPSGLQTKHFFTLMCLFEETMIQVADRFHGASGVESVVRALPYRILEAMVIMISNMTSINGKVRAHIGTNRIQRRQASR